MCFTFVHPYLALFILLSPNPILNVPCTHASSTCVKSARTLLPFNALTPTQEIKAHPFFDGINWEALHTQSAPYVPRVDHELDTQNFERFDEDMNMAAPGGLCVLEEGEGSGFLHGLMVAMGAQQAVFEGESCPGGGGWPKLCPEWIMSWTHRTLSTLMRT